MTTTIISGVIPIFIISFFGFLGTIWRFYISIIIVIIISLFGFSLGLGLVSPALSLAFPCVFCLGGWFVGVCICLFI